jgi:plastocyanin domain-containing protein
MIMKLITISIIIAVLIIGGTFIFTRNTDGIENVTNKNNVNVIDGTQVIEISAKGGYQPRKSIAKAGIRTIIRFNTIGTFDCSSSIRIPEMNINKNLPQTGSTDIDIGDAKIGTLRGSCGMGMYPFEIEFQS